MILDAKQIDIVKQWFKDHPISTKCPSCNLDPKLVLGNKVLAIIRAGVVQGRTERESRSYLPLIYITCQNCGSVRFFSAQAIGVLPDNWDATDSKDSVL